MGKIIPTVFSEVSSDTDSGEKRSFDILDAEFSERFQGVPLQDFIKEVVSHISVVRAFNKQSSNAISDIERKAVIVFDAPIRMMSWSGIVCEYAAKTLEENSTQIKAEDNKDSIPDYDGMMVSELGVVKELLSEIEALGFLDATCKATWCSDDFIKPVIALSLKGGVDGDIKDHLQNYLDQQSVHAAVKQQRECIK